MGSQGVNTKEGRGGAGKKQGTTEEKCEEMERQMKRK